MIDWIKSYQFNNLIALYTYWMPLAVCYIVYVFRFISRYKTDLKKSLESYYAPELTVGYILWHIIVATLPGVNIFALVFDCSASVFRWLARVLDIPLVKKREEIK